MNIYDAQLRNLDPQMGRWNQIDPKIEKMEMWSPCVSNYDNPIRYNDFLGDEPDGPGDPETWNTNSSGYDILKGELEIKAGIKNLISSVVSQLTSVNGMGPRTVYSVTEGMNDNGGRTAEITSSVVFDKDAGSRFLNWEVGKGAINLASLTPAGKIGALNTPMLAAEAGGPTVANEGVKLAEQASYTLTKHGELTNGVYTVSQEAMKKHVFGGIIHGSPGTPVK